MLVYLRKQILTRERKMKNRPIYGVIAAQVADIEQREILLGIIETAQEFNIDIAVISNIYNPIETDEVLITENRIYDMISSDKFDGSESIINSDVQKCVIILIVSVSCGEYPPSFQMSRQFCTDSRTAHR